MVNSLTLEQLRLLDKKAIELGLDERLLIENASSNLFEVINKLSLGRKVLVVAGSGNNGADVLSCARKLASRGYEVETVVVKEQNRNLGRETLFQKEILERIEVPIHVLDKNNFQNILQDLLGESDFILDGILGIGGHGEVSSFMKKVIKMINASAKTVVSCDVPSGLSSEQGIPLGVAIEADYTVTFLAPKPGFFVNEGQKFCGKIFVVDIGISLEIIKKALSKGGGVE